MRKNKFCAANVTAIVISVTVFFAVGSSAVHAADQPSTFTELLQTHPDDALVKRLAQMEQELRPDPSLPDAEQTLEQLHHYSEERLRQIRDGATRKHAEAYQKWKQLEEASQLNPSVADDWLSQRAALTLATTCATNEHQVKATVILGGESSHVLSRLLRAARSEVTHEFVVWARLIRETEQELQRRRTGTAAATAGQRTAEEKQGVLKLHANASVIELAVGKTEQIWFWVEQGYPPYQIAAYTFPGPNLGLELTFHNAQAFMLPVRSSTAGQYTLHVNATDQHGDTKQVSVELKVTEKPANPSEESPPESTAENAGEAAPRNPQTALIKPEEPPTKPPPATEPTTPRTRAKMPIGHFRARLWNASSAPGWLKDNDDLYTPLEISIDQSGTIRGLADYDVPLVLFNPGWAERRSDISQNVRFHLEGFTDPKTGKTTIYLREGRKQQRHLQMSNNGLRRYENIKEFNSTLYGWRVPGPSDDMLLSNPIVIGMRRNGRAQKQKNFPNIEDDRQGRAFFVQQGFFNHFGIDRQYEPGTHQITKRVNYWHDAKERGEIDDLKSSGPTSDLVAAWFLEILAPVEEFIDREPLALAICPRSPARMTDERVKLTAHAVYSDNVFKAVDVTEKATWHQTPGLQPVIGGSSTAQKGFYRLTKAAFDEQRRPRPQYVRAGIRKGSDWIADTIKVVPAPPKARAGQQPESTE